jgi:hypothetical protein
MNNMEEKLWNYIDGTCSDEERIAIAALIEKNESWHKAFNDMTQMDIAISEITLDEPPMAFSYKVMEGIRVHEAAKPLKTATNSYVIGAIAGFFVLTIMVVVALLFNGAVDNVNAKLPDFYALTSSSVIKIFFYVDVILLLFFTDAFLRRKRSNIVAKSV